MSIFSDILSAITTRGRRITIKMGLAKDFNDSKLKVGELGLVIDTDEVRIGLADGTTKELGGLDVADLPNASTTTKGVVQLNDSITSTSTTLGATANSVKKVADLANANKYTHPTSHPASMITGLATVATSGNYNDLLNKPSATVVGTAGTKDVGTTSGTIPIIGTNNKLDASIIPAIAITDVFVVNSQTAMLALVAQTGDVAVRTDLNKSFILKNDAASTLANWQELLTPSSPVQSVAGKIGAVTLVKGDVGLGNVDNTSDANKPVSTATQTALNNKVDKVTGKQLSTEDFTTVLKNKLEGLSTSGDYVLPTATSTVLGGVKVGTNINVTSGTISVANASTTTKGLVQLNDTLTSTSTSLGATARTVKELKDSINAITLSSLGGITIADIPIASATQDGLMPKAMVTKLSGIASGANFVQVTDNLTSTSAVQALSANQGKLLNDKLGNLSSLQTTNKNSLVDAINEVKQIGNNVKQNTVDALLSVDSSLPITGASTWNDIIIQIRNIKTDGSIIDLPNGYEWATDEDFSGTEDGGFWYIGTKQYVGIPSKIKGIDITSCANMFAYNTKTAIKGVASFNENITDLLNMFYENTSLTTLDLSNFNTSNVTRMSQMFMGCSSLTTLDLSNFNTSNVTRMSQMFNLCSSLTTLDLSSFNISNVTDMYAMLNGCSKITTAYARTQTDATRLNNSSDKPSTFTFVVKS